MVAVVVRMRASIALLLVVGGVVVIIGTFVPGGGGGGGGGGGTVTDWSQAIPDMLAPGTTTYFGFAGLLYTDPSSGVNTNTHPSQHSDDGVTLANLITPLDANGVATNTGKIGVVGIGMSNWTQELCVNNTILAGQTCKDNQNVVSTFIPTLTNYTVNPAVVVVDCAHDAAGAFQWVDNTVNNRWGNCINTDLPISTTYGGGGGITTKQIEVLIWKAADELGAAAYPCPTSPDINCSSISTYTSCIAVSATANQMAHGYFNYISRSNPEACLYEQNVGKMLRYAQTQFPNLRMAFLFTRIYAGYAPTGSLNPEPFGYEYGFATKWVINAQMTQRFNGTIDPIAGNLQYSTGSSFPPSQTAPWITWGSYWWAQGAATCSHCQVSTSYPTVNDYQADATHPSTGAITKVVSNMINFLENSVFASPWFP